MKTLIWISVAIFCTALLLGCGSRQMEVPPLQNLAQQVSGGTLRDEELSELLIGLPLADIQDAWGPEAHSLSGFFGLIWPLDDSRQIVLYFSPEKTVEGVKISEITPDIP